MKQDQNFISRLEVGDRFENTRGETCIVNKIDRSGNIEAGTDRTRDSQGLSRLRLYDKNGRGTPSSEQIKTS